MSAALIRTRHAVSNPYVIVLHTSLAAVHEYAPCNKCTSKRENTDRCVDHNHRHANTDDTGHVIVTYYAALLNTSQHEVLHKPAAGKDTFGLASRQDGVYLVHKDDSGLHAASDCKKGPHHLLALPNPFTGERGCTDVKEGGLDVACDGLANEGLACARRAKQEQPLCRGPCTLCMSHQLLRYGSVGTSNARFF